MNQASMNRRNFLTAVGGAAVLLAPRRANAAQPSRLIVQGLCAVVRGTSPKVAVGIVRGPGGDDAHETICLARRSDLIGSMSGTTPDSTSFERWNPLIEPGETLNDFVHWKPAKVSLSESGPGYAFKPGKMFPMHQLATLDATNWEAKCVSVLELSGGKWSSVYRDSPKCGHTNGTWKMVVGNSDKYPAFETVIHDVIQWTGEAATLTVTLDGEKVAVKAGSRLWLLRMPKTPEASPDPNNAEHAVHYFDLCASGSVRRYPRRKSAVNGNICKGGDPVYCPPALMA